MTEHAIPKDASTVVIMRPAIDKKDGPFEVLMVERHPASIFVPECYVFPGGCIDEEDCSDAFLPFCTGMNRSKASRILTDMPSEKLALGAWIAAVRETYEEAGILFSVDNVDADSLAVCRQRLVSGKMSYFDVLEKTKWRLALDRLHYFAHWITPEIMPYRYDVRFFVTVAPADQEATHDGIELTDNTWITPQRALAEYDEHRFNMVLPTVMTLQEIARFENIDAVIAEADAKKVPAILTTIEERDGILVEVMPDGKTCGPCL